MEPNVDLANLQSANEQVEVYEDAIILLYSS